MNLQELSEKYHFSESSIKSNFPRVQNSIWRKYKVRIIKEGRGDKATYKEEESDCRALTMYEEVKNDLVISNENFRTMANWDFLVFLAIITTPMLVFRGSYEDFLNYVQVNPSKNNIEALKEALASLSEKEFISYNVDKTDKNWFVAALYRKVEEEMHIGIGMVRRCKSIADKNNKRSWIPLLKTWLGVQIAAESQPFTYKDLSLLTGLSEYQLRENKKLLEKDEIFRTSKAYLAFDLCLGTNVDLNAFYN